MNETIIPLHSDSSIIITEVGTNQFMMTITKPPQPIPYHFLSISSALSHAKTLISDFDDIIAIELWENWSEHFPNMSVADIIKKLQFYAIVGQWHFGTEEKIAEMKANKECTDHLRITSLLHLEKFQLDPVSCIEMMEGPSNNEIDLNKTGTRNDK